jgi:adenylate cyclase
MATEIERKFLVLHDGWRATAGRGRLFRQGYVARGGGATVRVRRIGERATLTVKGPRRGISRSEFEYEVPLEDAERMLRELCRHPLQKVRYEVPYGGLTWEVDVFEGEHHGLVLAEIELARPDQHVALPPWIGAEVTHDPRYRGSALVRSGGWPAISEASPVASLSASALPLG